MGKRMIADRCPIYRRRMPSMAKLTLLLFINIAASQAFRSLSFCISLHFDKAVNVKEKKSFWLSQLKFHQLQLPGLPYDWHWVFLVSWTSVSILKNLDRLFKKYPLNLLMSLLCVWTLSPGHRFPSWPTTPRPTGQPDNQWWWRW